jgi:hypothetical protein
VLLVSPPAHAQAVAVVGDSLSVGLAAAMSRSSPETVRGYGVVSSGLSRVMPVDWQVRIRAVVATHPSSVVVLVGMNDTPDATYRQRVADFLAPVTEARIPLTVIAVPQTADAVRIDALNRILAQAASDIGARFVPLPRFPRAERTRDGIHFTPCGYAHLARVVLAAP